MGSMAPDWRAIGSASATAGDPPSAGHLAVSKRHVIWIAGALVATLMAGAIVALVAMPTTGGVVIDGAGPESMDARGARELVADLGPAVPRDGAPLVVDVEGAVMRPGLVHVPIGGRVADALELAGGFAANADLAATAATINLAEAATDGLKVVVPAMGDAGSAPGQGPISGAAVPLDLNRATEAELDGLPGVGPATIAKIVAAREESPFRSVDELRSSGILGEATFGKLRELVTVGG
jgi:competence protein ComEA